jgi:8-oxo-dGTP pyrophosphatase MutT (NUDIX family)
VDRSKFDTPPPASRIHEPKMIDSAAKGGALCARTLSKADSDAKGGTQFSWTTAKNTPKLYTNKAFQSLAFRGRAASVFSRPPQRPPQQAHKTYGAIILATADDGQIRYALVQGRYTGKWSFPKGHANEGEAPIACTKREVTEETGLEELPEPIEYIQVGYGTYHVFHISSLLPLCPHDTNEIMDTRWVTLEEMRALPLNADASMFTRSPQTN